MTQQDPTDIDERTPDVRGARIVLPVQMRPPPEPS